MLLSLERLPLKRRMIIAVSRKRRRTHEILLTEEDKVKLSSTMVSTQQYTPTEDTSTFEGIPVDPIAAFALSVLITCQKGIIHLANAIKYIDPGYAGRIVPARPDTPEIAKEMRTAKEVKKNRDNGDLTSKMLGKGRGYSIVPHADVFCCPSIYEPSASSILRLYLSYGSGRQCRRRDKGSGPWRDHCHPAGIAAEVFRTRRPGQVLKSPLPRGSLRSSPTLP